jgi:uncharacterized membrane protein HdeD (DUF308 family)
MAGPWWVLLLTGIAWLIISVIVLRFTTTSAATIGVLLGVVFLVAMANEFFIASVRLGWRWAHVLMGIIFLAAARPQLAASHAPAVCLRRWRYLAAGAQMAADAPTRLQQGEVRSAWSWSGSR